MTSQFGAIFIPFTNLMRRFIWRVSNKRTCALHTATSCHGNTNRYAVRGYMLFYCKSHRRTQVVLYSCKVSMSYHIRIQSYKERVGKKSLRN